MSVTQTHLLLLLVILASDSLWPRRLGGSHYSCARLSAESFFFLQDAGLPGFVTSSNFSLLMRAARVTAVTRSSQQVVLLP